MEVSLGPHLIDHRHAPKVQGIDAHTQSIAEFISLSLTFQVKTEQMALIPVAVKSLRKAAAASSTAALQKKHTK